MPADLIWPNELRPLTVSWNLLQAGGAARATSGALHTADYGFGLWRCMARWQGDLYRGNLPLGEVEGYLTWLLGQTSTVGIPRWDRSEGPRGGITTPKPTASNTGELGRSLTVGGISGGNPVFRPGDVFSYMDFMYMITEPINAAGGSAQLKFRPDLKLASVAGQDVRFQGINSGVESETVRTKMVLESFSSPEAAFRAPAIGQITAVFLEVVA